MSAEQITVAELANRMAERTADLVARSGRPVELAYLRGQTTTTVTLVPTRAQP